MPSQYESLPPTTGLPKGIKEFFEQFYRISDTPGEDAHVAYANGFFTKEAVLVMGVKRVEGIDAIRKFRVGMWELVKERSHKPTKIFDFPPPASATQSQKEGKREVEVMIYGDVGYVFKDGRKAEVDWAARAILVPTESDVDGENVKENASGWKMRFYQVYLDSAALQSAK